MCLPLRAAAVALTIVTVALWGLAAAATWARFGRTAMDIETAGAAATAVLAGMAWMAGFLRNEEWRTLIRLCGDLYQRIPEDGRPPLVRSAR
jgi:hypothetical protein